MKQKILIISAFILLVVVGFGLYKWYQPKVAFDEFCEELAIFEPTMEYGILVDSFETELYVIPKNMVLSQILNNFGATATDLTNVSLLKRDIFDARSIRAGNRCKIYHAPDSTRKLCYFVYEKSPVDYAVICFKDSFSVYHGQKEVISHLKRSEAVVSSSLWNAAVDNDIDPMLALSLSEIYAWVVDFFGLQKGDRFVALYDELYVDSVHIGIGRVHAALFQHAGKEYQAYYFEQDSAGSYWDESGNSLQRAFLKAPLKFSRISSHFSYARKHPVLRIVRPHTGVDYVAPKGTPVMSIGDGTVTEKGYKGGGGNTVKIKHNSVYTTAYLHLSAYSKDIQVGSRVSQGQVIGFVGSTGVSTGPHLDFRVWKNNQAVNPLTIESPPVEPVHETNRQAFDSISHAFNVLLAQ